MRRALIGQDNAISRGAFAFRFAMHQHLDPAGQAVDLGLLGGDDIRQVIDRADQMGQLFFKVLHHASFCDAVITTEADHREG